MKNYVFFSAQLNEISNAPTIDFSTKDIAQDAIIEENDTNTLPLGYRDVLVRHGHTSDLIEVEPAINSVKDFKNLGQKIKSTKSIVYYRQWLLCVALSEPSFDFAARCFAFLKNE